MRSEREMFDLILGVAQKDERIRAVYMNGSRTNVNAPKDIFQDYDIVYVVTETASFIEDKHWIDVFGDLIILQEPDKLSENCGKLTDFNNYGYLMLFTDGNRIDLHIQTKEYMRRVYLEDKLTVPLLDKDNCLPKIAEPTDEDYWVKRPTEEQYDCCCNDFWWCQQNVAKGLWRDELPYAKEMLESVIRPRLNDMVAWWIGIKNNFQVSAGKMGKYFKRYLPENYWTMYEKTYSDSNKDNIWNGMFVAGDLFRILAKEVGHYFGFTYPIKDDENMVRYLKVVRLLPSDAKDIEEI